VFEHTKCDDGNSCSTDSCSKTGCVHKPSAADCDDKSACTTGDKCGEKNGKAVCLAGTATVCNDANPCTADSCDAKKGCVHKPKSAHQPCYPADAKTKGKGMCKPGVATCHEGVLGKCVGAVVPAGKEACDGKDDDCDGKTDEGACDDSDACTKDVCEAKTGKCIHTAAADCDDKSVCTVDTCAKATGKCVFTPKGNAPCEDGDTCTKGDVCKQGKCVSGPSCCTCKSNADCAGGDDGNMCNGTLHCAKQNGCTACKVDVKTIVKCDTSKDTACLKTSCTPKTGQCEQQGAGLNGKTCDDGTACTEKDTCKSGVCAGGKAVKCDDGNVCTDDSCDKAKGCIALPNTASCTDANACTVEDRCHQGACKPGAAAKCDDGNVCTDDTCKASSGCAAAANTRPCDADGSVCTQKDTCAAKACLAGAKQICADGNPCTADLCDAKIGCKFPHAKDGLSCSDGNACTVGDKCAAGKCVGVGKDCNDKNDCTADTCSDDKCTNKLRTGPCDDGDVCSVADACDGKGSCVGKALKCDDGNKCTDNACKKAVGCVKTFNTTPCDDGQVCTVKDACAQGQCKGGAQKDCDDKQVCTLDVCVSGKGCLHLPTASTCTGGDKCTKDDTCKDGKCASGKPVNCDDGNVCTDDACDAKAGCSSTANTKSCSDGNACTEGDKCSSTTCKIGAPKKCDDGNICTADSCVPTTGCSHNPGRVSGTSFFLLQAVSGRYFGARCDYQDSTSRVRGTM